MCRATTCSTCHKTTWVGCGLHVPSVMDSVDEDDRCTCEPKVERDGKEYPPKGSMFGAVQNLFSFGGKKS